jgi:hypothetical protein
MIVFMITIISIDFTNTIIASLNFYFAKNFNVLFLEINYSIIADVVDFIDNFKIGDFNSFDFRLGLEIESIFSLILCLSICKKAYLDMFSILV